MHILDNVETYQSLDPAGMRERIRELPEQCRRAWALTCDLDLPAAYSQARKVVVLGMGGSAIGGALVAGLVSDHCAVPILCASGYDLPAHSGTDSLVVGSSYSGDTEETLSALGQAIEQDCRMVVITTGGRMLALAEEHGIPILRFDYPSRPRAALGFSFTLLLGLLSRLGLVPDYAPDVQEAVAVMERWQEELAPTVPTARNPAKQLAAELAGHLPVVYGAGFLAAAARRWKGQLNENAKIWAFWEELPELNHNAVVGYNLPEHVRARAAVVALRSEMDHPRVCARWDVTADLLHQADVPVHEVWGRGHTRLAQMMSVVQFGDCVSLYLALLNGVDPSSMEQIDYLKRKLAAP